MHPEVPKIEQYLRIEKMIIFLFLQEIIQHFFSFWKLLNLEQQKHRC